MNASLRPSIIPKNKTANVCIVAGTGARGVCSLADKAKINVPIKTKIVFFINFMSVIVFVNSIISIYLLFSLKSSYLLIAQKHPLNQHHLLKCLESLDRSF